MSKTHAKDYLIEYANSLDKDWLKCLIIETINTNGNISNEKLEEIYLNLSQNSPLTIPAITSKGVANTSIILHSLKHISGINALANDQTITFSPNITILHGMNGAGKSSYFRILNEIIGGNQVKTIIPNIYTETPAPIDVELKFKKNATASINTIIWDGTDRALPELSNCRVFDSSYLDGFLQPRSVDEALILPLGLKLFTYLATKIDEFKTKLNEDIQNIKIKKPVIDYTKFLQEKKNALLENNIPEKIRTEIETCYVFSTEDEKKLADILRKITELKQVNIADKIALLNKNKQAYTRYKEQIDSICREINKIIPEITSAIQVYQNKKQNSENAKAQFEIFKTIPDSDSKEWKQFIQAAHKYHPNGDDTICPYCRQSLQTEQSKSLLMAYFAFITDTTEEELKIAEQSINEKVKQIESINTNLTISEDIEKLIEGKNVGTQTLKQYFLHNISALNSVQTSLSQALFIKKLPELTTIFDFKEIITILDNECKKIDGEIELLNQSPETKAQTIKSLEHERSILEEKQEIARQRDKFENWFKLDDLEKKLLCLVSAISTSDITRLSNKANEELLTEKLKHNFIEELKELGKQELQVDLVKAGNFKGKQSTKLILRGNKRVTDILSEGEQKAIGLALFLAEIKSSETCNPIILDDPVNSLDHQIAGKFAERLLKLTNQIIIFNHILLFLDAFECSKGNHVCKSGKTACNKQLGKHIKIYLIQSEGQNQKGVVTDYKWNKANCHIEEAKKILKKTPFEDDLKLSALIRKCVECCIDEVIFRNQSPTRFSNKNSRINWDSLKLLVTDTNTIDKLRSIHDRVSGGDIHNGTETSDNPISKDEFNQFVADIENIIATHKISEASE